MIAKRLWVYSGFLLVFLAKQSHGATIIKLTDRSAFSGNESVAMFLVDPPQALPYSEVGATFTGSDWIVGPLRTNNVLQPIPNLTVTFDDPVSRLGFGFSSGFPGFNPSLTVELFADATGSTSIGEIFLGSQAFFTGLESDTLFRRAIFKFTGQGLPSITRFRFEDAGSIVRPTEGFIDFNTRADGTPYTSPHDFFLPNEYASLGVTITTFVTGVVPPGFPRDAISVLVVNPANVNTDISGFHVNIPGGLELSFSHVDIEFEQGSREVSIDFATPFHPVLVLGFNSSGATIFEQDFFPTDIFLDPRGREWRSGRAVVSGVGNLYKVRVQSLSLISGFFMDNLRYEAPVPTSSTIASDVQLGSGVVVGEQVLIETGVVVGARTRISDLVGIARDSTIGSDVLLGVGSLIARDVSIRDRTLIGPGSRIERGSTIGSDVVVGEDSAIERDVQMGDGVQVGDRTTIGKESVVGDGARIGSDTTIGKMVQIGANAVVGNNVIIQKGTIISDGAVIPDGAIVP